MSRIRFAQTVLLYVGIRISHAVERAFLADGRHRAARRPMKTATGA